MDLETLVVEVGEDHVATVTLNRPAVMNSFNRRMCDEFEYVWERLRDDVDVHAIVLRAAGDRAFSTGVDVQEFLAEDSPFLDAGRPWSELTDLGSSLSPKRNAVWKPIVAAVHGMCAGGAAYWIAECDIVICEPEATFFDPHVSYGLVAALEPIALTYRMNTSDVLRMALLGLQERMTAERAMAAGLVTEIVDRDQLFDRAHELAAVIASYPPVAVQGTVKAIWRSFDLARGQALASALMYTEIGNPIATEGLDRAQAKPKQPWLR